MPTRYLIQPAPDQKHWTNGTGQQFIQYKIQLKITTKSMTSTTQIVTLNTPFRGFRRHGSLPLETKESTNIPLLFFFLLLTCLPVPTYNIQWKD